MRSVWAITEGFGRAFFLTSAMCVMTVAASAGPIVKLTFTQYFDYNEPLNVPGIPSATWISAPFDVSTQPLTPFADTPTSTSQLPAGMTITSTPIFHWEDIGVLEFIPATFTYQGVAYTPVLNDNVPFCYQPCTFRVGDYFLHDNGIYTLTAHFDVLSGVLVTVPEPATFAFVGVGALGLVAIRRRDWLQRVLSTGARRG